MGAYSFKAQFVPFLLDGSKTHTIRASRRHMDKPGNTCHLFYAMRTKQCRKLFSAPCIRVEQVEIDPRHSRIRIEGIELSESERDALAYRDGFRKEGLRSAFFSMIDFWTDTHGLETFYGHIVHWDFSKRQFTETVMAQEIELQREAPG